MEKKGLMVCAAITAALAVAIGEVLPSIAATNGAKAVLKVGTYNIRCPGDKGMLLVSRKMKEFAPPGTPIVFTADPRPGKKLYPSDHFPVLAEIVL